MDSIYLGLSVVFPLLVYMIIGILLKKRGWLSEQTLTELNKLVFRVFLFVMIFLNSYSIDLYHTFNRENLQVLILAVVSVLVILAVSELILSKRKMEKKKKAVIIQGIYRSNLVLFGLPVTLAIYEGGSQSTISLLIAVIVPLYNIAATLLLAKASGRNTSAGQLVKQVVSNPLVCGSLLGMLFNLLGIVLPELILNTLTGLSRVATPLAFIVLGGSLVFQNIKKDLKVILSVSVLRLVVIPMAVLSAAIALGIRNEALVALLGMFASSTAVASYTMAKNMETEPELAGEIVAATTMAFVVTMFLWITVLNYGGVI